MKITVTRYLLLFGLAAILGCSAQNAERQAQDDPITSGLSEAGPVEPQPQSDEFGQLVIGLDGAMYDAYKPTVVERIQLALRDRGLYSGPVNGLLDALTMSAISTFQKANYNLQISGVPTPRTRLLLEQGSHTDP